MGRAVGRQEHMKKTLRIFGILIALFVLAVLCIIISNLLKTPSHDRDWSEEVAILPGITLSTSTINIKNMRDWRYGYKEVRSRDYYEDTFDLEKVSKAYLLFNPFGKWDGVGHSFFVFEFEDGKTVSVSIEARSEKGESYDAIRGIFNNYEMWYVFGSAADLMSRRAIYHNEDLYMYELRISNEGAAALLRDLATTAERIETEPAFYNTFTSNCTNLLADSANRVKKGSVPFHYSRLFTGYADDQLYDLGLIRNDKPFDQVFAESRIDQMIREKFGELNSYESFDFWQEIIR